ncbi:amidase [Pseudonocardia sp. GCM10023141]|uniref:amidase n=1 Tax=Pseudonocardia sp. GCM10023141 TaxID=3252653 RepID=UPI0036074407
MSSLAEDTRWLDATGQAGLVRTGQVHPSELLEAAIERIETLDPAVNAVVVRWFDEARATAAGELPDGPFRGVPFLLKDLWAAYAGQPSTNGNVRLKELLPRAAADTTLVSRFRAAGLVTAGRTNSCEMGSLPTTEPEAWGATHNPWNLAHSPGGSSGGSGAAVASGMVPIAHASDGGGSIRIPASCCGLVGLKPTQGRITLGPARDESNLGVELCLSRSVRDVATMLDAVRGPGVGDTVIAPPPLRPYVEELGAEPGSLRIGLLDHRPTGEPVHEECATAVRNAARLLESLGHEVEPGFPRALADPGAGQRFGALWATNMAVSIAALGDQLGRPATADDVEAINWALAERARALTAVDYARALAAAAQYRRAVHQWWADGFDLLITPTLAEPPVLLGTFANNPADPIAPMVRAGAYVPFTPVFNTTGQPAISLPLHWTPEGLPVGVQLVAAYGREDVLLRVAAQLEQAAPWADRRPGL